MAKRHTIHGYDNQLAELRATAVKLRGILLEMLGTLVCTFREEKISETQKVLDLSVSVARYKELIDHQATVTISLMQPVGSDLRLLITTLKQSTHLESIGRYCVNICNRLAEIDGSKGYLFSADFAFVLQSLTLMLEQEIGSFTDSDDETAARIMLADRDIDLKYSLLLKKLIDTGAAGFFDSHALMKTHSIVKNIERIGDHISELAELDVYMAVGVHPREKKTPINIRGIVFLCVQNACRSQIAEGLARNLFSDKIQILSAGSEPASAVEPLAVEAMKELGIDISAHHPKSIGDLHLEHIDMVITVCKEEVCVDIPAIPVHQTWDMANPKILTLETIRELRERIMLRIRELGTRYGMLKKGVDN